MNNQSGYLMRTKISSSDEGGVAAGFAVIDSVYLTWRRAPLTYLGILSTHCVYTLPFEPPVYICLPPQKIEREATLLILRYPMVCCIVAQK